MFIIFNFELFKSVSNAKVCKFTILPNNFEQKFKKKDINCVKIWPFAEICPACAAFWQSDMLFLQPNE